MNDKGVVAKGAFWNILERIGTQSITIIFTIILARLIDVEEYGIIAITTVIITIFGVIVDGGFSAAIIQKKDIGEKDLSTVFYFNIFVSILLMGTTIILAPVIAKFYELATLIVVIRVLSIKLPLSAVISLQQAIIMRNLQFNKFFYASILAMGLGGSIGVILAYMGYGIWALIAQDLSSSIVTIVILYYLTKWKPKIYFSFLRLRSLFDFGSKLLVQSLLNAIFGNLRTLLIGKYYSAQNLALYNKGIQYPNLIVTNIDTAISRALFPVMSRSQDDISKIKELARSVTKISSYFLAPLLVGLFFTAEEFTAILLTEKWLGMVPYLRIICICLLIRAPQTSLLQSIKSIGRSDIVLKMDIPVRIFGLILLFISIKYGIIYIAWSEVIVETVVLVTYMYYGKRFINYKYMELLGDFIKNNVLAIMMGIIVYIFGNFIDNIYLRFSLQILIGAASYILLSIVMKNDSYIIIRNLLMKGIKR